MVAVTVPTSDNDAARRKTSLWSVGARLDAPVAVLDQAVVSGVNFLTAQILIAWGSKEVGGAFALAWVFVLFTRSTIINLVAAPYTVRRGRGEATFSNYAASSFIQQLAISLAAALILASAGALFYWQAPGAGFNSSVSFTLLAAATMIPFMMAREYARQISFAAGSPLAALTMDIVAGAMQMALLCASLSWFAAAAPLAYLASGAGALCGVAVWWTFALQPMRLNAKRTRDDWSENWKFGRWALLSQVTGNLAPLPWIIFAFWGAGETGAFDGANRIVGLSNILVMGYCNYLAAAAATAYASQGGDRLQKVVSRAVLIFTAGLGAMCVLAWLWGGELLTLVMRGRIENAGGIVAILALATLFDGLSQVALHALRAMNRPADAFLPDLGEVFVTLAFAIPLVWNFSAPGAAWAMVFGRFAGLLLRWSVYLHRVKRDSVAPAVEGVPA